MTGESIENLSVSTDSMEFTRFKCLTKVDSSEQVDFSRIEDKFLVPVEKAPQLIKVIESHLKPFYPIPGTEFTLIESMYFDSKNLDVFRNHFEQEERFKIRSRRYGPNGTWQNDTVLLERKTKKDQITKKFRFEIGTENYQRLSKGKTLVPNEDLRQKNLDLTSKKLLRRVSKINGDIEKYGLLPEVAVVYKRLSFEEHGLRMTIDTDLRFDIKTPINKSVAREIKESPYWPRVIAMQQRFNSSKAVILEVKHSGRLPKWITDFLRSVGTEKSSFSKYCFAVSSHILKSEGV